MRHLSLSLMAMAVLMTLFAAAGCSDDEPGSQEPIDQLPPATREGRNTFGCLVNGEAWVTKTSIYATAVYQDQFLNIGAELEGGDEIRTLVFGLEAT
ncbi:MAG: hypothetical protein AAGG59_08065 [Bacteroidota bacterium]